MLRSVGSARCHIELDAFHTLHRSVAEVVDESRTVREDHGAWSEPELPTVAVVPEDMA